MLSQKGDIAASLLKFWAKLSQKGDIAAGLLTFWTKKAISLQTYWNFEPEIGSGPQKEVALAGLPYEVKISGPQKEVALAGLP